MLKIALGTTSEIKGKFIKEVLDEIGISAEVFPVEVDSDVSSQPAKTNETKQGSLNRAKEALNKIGNADIGLGIEFGYEPKNGALFMHAWSTIIDHRNVVFSEQSSTLELPKHFVDLLKKEEEIGLSVRDFQKRNESKEWQYFAGVIRYREPFIKESSRNVLLRYHFRNEY